MLEACQNVLEWLSQPLTTIFESEFESKSSSMPGQSQSSTSLVIASLSVFTSPLNGWLIETHAWLVRDMSVIYIRKSLCIIPLFTKSLLLTNSLVVVVNIETKALQLCCLTCFVNAKWNDVKWNTEWMIKFEILQAQIRHHNSSGTKLKWDANTTNSPVACVMSAQ